MTHTGALQARVQTSRPQVAKGRFSEAVTSACALAPLSPRRHQRSGSDGLAPLSVAMLVAGFACALPMASPSIAPYGILLVGGLVSGWLAGMLGIGGALITLPVLYLTLPALGVASSELSATAVATALVAMVPTTIVATWRQHRRRTLDLVWLRRLVAPMTIGAAAGALAATYVNGPVLGLAFAAQSVVYGTRLLCGRIASAAADGSAGRPRGAPPWLAGPAMAAFCACVGMGGGSLVPGYLQRRGVEFRSAVATGSALNLCIALGGSAAFVVACGHTAAGASACWPAGLLLGAGAVVAAPFGVEFAHRLNTRTLRCAVAAVNIVAAVSLVGAIWRR